MEKLLRFDISAYEKEINQTKNEGKVDSMKDPALFYINQPINLGDISKYEVNAKIGRGRYSEVYSGLIKNTDTKVVIKILKVKKTKKKIIQILKKKKKLIMMKIIIKIIKMKKIQNKIILMKIMIMKMKIIMK